MPDSRMLPVLAALLVFAPPALAQAPPARPTSPLYACAAIAEDAGRLACFDAAVATLRAAEDSGDVQTVSAADIEKIEREAFGFALPSLPDLLRGRGETASGAVRDEIEEVTAGIDSINTNPATGKLSVKLSNGQVWEQIDSTKLQGYRIKNATSATVKKAALGSFKMTLENTGTMRVRRTN